MSSTSVWSGACVPNPFENIPRPEKARRPCGSGRPEPGSELAPRPASAVRVVHRQRVGLRVEHPVFQGQHVIFREQKIEVPVPGGEGDTLSVL